MQQKSILLIIAGLLIISGIFFIRKLYFPSQFIHPSPTQITISPTTYVKIDNSTEGKFCGGIAANLPENKCPVGYICKLDGDYPDAGGRCTKKY